ncbi:MAG: aminoacyltransferase [Betaproteobacteria bacterium]|nr:MAG: aminoacyltransferase [Betaproteobacteria bacterium]
MVTKREEYIAKLKTQLDQWNAEMAKWESQAAQAQASMRAEYENQLAAIRRHQDQAREQLRKVQAASGDAWMELSRGADEVWAAMRKAFEKASAQFTQGKK